MSAPRRRGSCSRRASVRRRRRRRDRRRVLLDAGVDVLTREVRRVHDVAACLELGAHRSQHQPPCHAPWTRENVAMRRSSHAHHRRQPEGPHDPRAAGLDTRPTSDRVRENIFNIVGPLDGAAVLDLFAGSGAMGLEALSRGAARAVFVERDPRRGADDRAEPRQAAAEGASVVRGDALSALAQEAGAGGSTISCWSTRPTTCSPTIQPRSRATCRRARRGRRRRRRDRRAHRARAAAAAAHEPQVRRRRGSRVFEARSDHGDLPGLVRPGDERPRRRDHARGRDLRPRRRRRRRRLRSTRSRCSRSRSASSSCAARSRASTTSRSTSSASSSSTSRSRWDAKAIVKGLRVISDFEWEFQMNQLNRHSRAGRRDGVRDGEPAGELRLLERREGDRGVRRRRLRARARAGRAPASRSSSRTGGPGRRRTRRSERARRHARATDERCTSTTTATRRPRRRGAPRHAGERARLRAGRRATRASAGCASSATTAPATAAPRRSPAARSPTSRTTSRTCSTQLGVERFASSAAPAAGRTRSRSARSCRALRRGRRDRVADAVGGGRARLARGHGRAERRGVRRRARGPEALEPLLEREAASPRAAPPRRCARCSRRSCRRSTARC